MEPGDTRGGRRRRLKRRGTRAGVPAPSSSPAPASVPVPASVHAATTPQKPVDPAVDGLHVCPECRSTLVQPLDWHDAGPDHWLLERFCPECWWTAEERHAQDVMEVFDVVLDDGTDALIRALHTLTAERMQEDVERFAAALRAGALLPEDF
jgi:hypothetical protein